MDSAYRRDSDRSREASGVRRWPVLVALVAAIVGIFVGRTALAHSGTPPSLFTIFNTITIALSLVVVARAFRLLTRRDWLVALVTSALLGALVPATGFNALGATLVPSGQPFAKAALHGLCLFVVLLAGLAIMRKGGPVQVRLADGHWSEAGRGFLVGAVLGIPLAILNVLAFMQMQGRGPVWQSPVAALLSALEPGVVEEVAYRLTFLGILWIALRPGWPDRAVLLAAFLSVVVHGYSHLDAMLLDQPVFALVYGGVLSLAFGAPMAYLAVRRDLETASGFHWVQDALRFLAGF